jgi:hypothetical protein
MWRGLEAKIGEVTDNFLKGLEAKIGEVTDNFLKGLEFARHELKTHLAEVEAQGVCEFSE